MQFAVVFALVLVLFSSFSQVGARLRSNQYVQLAKRESVREKEAVWKRVRGVEKNMLHDTRIDRCMPFFFFSMKILM